MRHVFLILLCASVAEAAGAAPPTVEVVSPPDTATEEAKKLFHQAELEYKLGRFDSALTLFSKAYETKPIPAFLFNIGQCHFNLKNYERAMFFYEGYLRDLPGAPNRLAVGTQIAIARHELAKQQRLARKNHTEAPAETPVAPAPEPAPAPKQIEAAPVYEPASVPAPAPMPEAEVTTPVYKKWWLWTIVGVVVAGGAATAVALVLTQPKHAAAAPPTIDWRLP